MAEIIILMGTGRAGKTTYADKIEKKGYEGISFDRHYHYGKEDFFKFVDFLIDKLNKNKDKNFILDQYLHLDKNFNYLKNNLKFHKIRAIVIFESYEIIKSRGKGGATRVATKDEVVRQYKSIQKFYENDIEKFVRGSDYSEVKTWKEVMDVLIGGGNES